MQSGNDILHEVECIKYARSRYIFRLPFMIFTITLRIWINSIEEIEVSGEPTSNSQVLNPPSGGSAGHVDRRGV